MSNDFVDFILDQLRDLPGVEARSMFGAHGLYAGDTFFAIACKGELYFKTDEKSRGEYERRGMKPFQPSSKQTIRSYLQVPPDVIDSRDELVKWGRRAIRAAKA